MVKLANFIQLALGKVSRSLLFPLPRHSFALFRLAVLAHQKAQAPPFEFLQAGENPAQSEILKGA